MLLSHSESLEQHMEQSDLWEVFKYGIEEWR